MSDTGINKDTTKMTTIDKIRAEIERRLKEDYNFGDEEIDSVAQGVCAGILSFLDTLQGPEVDLDEAADAYVGNHPEIDEGVYTYAKRLAFKAGAKWMEARFEHCGTFPIEDQRGGYWPTDYYIKKK